VTIFVRQIGKFENINAKIFELLYQLLVVFILALCFDRLAVDWEVIGVGCWTAGEDIGWVLVFVVFEMQIRYA